MKILKSKRFTLKRRLTLNQDFAATSLRKRFNVYQRGVNFSALNNPADFCQLFEYVQCCRMQINSLFYLQINLIGTTTYYKALMAPQAKHPSVPAFNAIGVRVQTVVTLCLFTYFLPLHFQWLFHSINLSICLFVM